MYQLLRELSETPGVSGEESEIRQLIRDKIEDEADGVKVDDYGNLIATKGKGDSTLMIDAHMDQIGMGVRRIDDEGFIRIARIGGAYPISIVNQRVKVHSSGGEEIKGVIGAKPSHLLDDDDEGLPQMEKAFVDIGAHDAEDVREKGIRVGDFITFDRSFEQLSNDYVTGPALDNRIGCAVAIEAFSNFDGDYELKAVFSAQEEVGAKGAATASFDIDPDAALVLDVARAGDLPNMDPDESDEETGDGFGITMVEAGGRGVIVPEKVREWLLKTAEEGGFNYHRKLYEKGRTNASSIDVSSSGVPTGVIVIPTRHLHSPVEVADITDIQEAVDFVSEAFKNFDELEID